MSIEIIVTNNHRRTRVGKNKAGAYIRRVLRLEGRRNASVSLVFVDSKAIRELNRRYLRHDRVTDVIAFPLETGRLLEGEVYVNIDRARRQALAYRVSFGEEIARLVIHGTLHLAGYDDTSPSVAKVMKRAENRHVRYWFDRTGGEG